MTAAGDCSCIQYTCEDNVSLEALRYILIMKMMKAFLLLWSLGQTFCSYDDSNPTNVYVKQGEEAILICDFGNAGLRWHVYNGSEWQILANAGNTVDDTKYYTTTNLSTGLYDRLHIMNSLASDEKLYRCRLSGIDKFYFVHLNLLAPPTNISILNIVNNRLIGTEGQDLHVTCSANGKPAPIVTIVKDGAVLRNATRSAQYIFHYINRDHDRKSLQCQAKNDAAASPLNKTVEIYLNLKPLQPTFNQKQISTDENTPLMVSCESVGSRPAAVFLWLIGETNVTSSSLIIQSSQQADETYHVTSQLQLSLDRSGNGQQIICTAVNIAGDNGTTRVLDVKYPPDVTVSNVTYNQNDVSRTVTCTAVGNPLQYTYGKWIHKSEYGVLIRELDGGHDGVLTLPSETVSDRYQDSGEYVCTASNGIKDEDGNTQQTGSGYVVVHSQPIFTKNNNNTQYGEIDKIVDINVFVYSVPVFTAVQWFIGNTLIPPSGRYTMSDTTAVVYDTFHGKEVQLDGYRITLRITNLGVSDFNTTYKISLANSVGSALEYSVLLESASAPQSPSNFSVVSYRADSIVVQWIPGYNGGHDQTFIIEYRTLGTETWIPHPIPGTKQSGLQTYTLSGLQGGTVYELRMYAVNKFNRSLMADLAGELRALPRMDEEASSLGPIIGGIVGGLTVAVMVTVILLIVLKRNKGSSKTESEKNVFYQNVDGRQNKKNLKNQADERPVHMESSDNYETLGSKNASNTYDLIENNKDQSNSDTYEQLGKKEHPDTYDVISPGKGKDIVQASKDNYRVTEDKDKASYENIVDRKDVNQVYVNLKI